MQVDSNTGEGGLSSSLLLVSLAWFACSLILAGCVSQAASSSAPASPDPPAQNPTEAAGGVDTGGTIPNPTPTLESTGSPTRNPTITNETSVGGRADADVTFVRAEYSQEQGAWTFHVTVQHPDTGWDDYADGWDVFTPDGEVLKPNPQSQFTRTLLHPHVNEQPFTRSQSGIAIPEEVEQVHVRAHDLVHGFGGQEVIVDLTTGSGPNFEVER